MQGAQRLARAKHYIAIAESADSKREAYKMAAEEIAAHKAETGDTHEVIGGKLQLSETAKAAKERVSKLLQWRDKGYPGDSPWARPGKDEGARAAHAKRTLREKPEALAGEIAEALEKPAVRKAVEREQLKRDAGYQRLQEARAERERNLPPEHERKANQARSDETMRQISGAIISVVSPLVYIDDAIAAMETVEKYHGKVGDLEACMDRWAVLGRMMWEHGALQGLDVSAISRALDQYGEDA